MSNAKALFESLTQGVDLQVGKHVVYILTDEEGGNIKDQHQAEHELPNRKCLAEVNYCYPPGTREDASLICSLSIKRPLFRGGDFQKDEVRFTAGRDPGTCDAIQESDVGSIIGTLN